MRPSGLLRLALGLAVSVSAVSAPHPALAQASKSDEANRLNREGGDHFNRKAFAEAIASYKEGYRVKPDPVFLFNIAQAYRHLNEFGQALPYYRSYLQDRPNAPNRDEVNRRIAEIETRQRETEVGAVPPSPPAPENETGVMADSVSASASGAPPGAANRKDWMPWFMAGVGGALIAGGIVTGVMAAGRQSDLEGECPARINCSDKARDLQSSGRTLAIATDVLLVTGVAAAVTGVVWAIKNRRGRAESAPAPVALGCGSTGCHVGVRISF